MIIKYFPDITERQKEQFERLGTLYQEWNARINVVSRKDMEHLYTRHILHSLAIAKVCQFEAGARVLDIGCGGGFPSVPLAIMFPEVEFVGCDSIAKKIRVVEGVKEGAEINNLRAVNCRAEQLGEKFDYVVSRAVTEMARFMPWAWLASCHGHGHSCARDRRAHSPMAFSTSRVVSLPRSLQRHAATGTCTTYTLCSMMSSSTQSELFTPKRINRYEQQPKGTQRRGAYYT